MRPEFGQLATFLKIVEARGRASAARLHGWHPTGDQPSIRTARRIFGGNLFVHRRGAPLALTPIGEAILLSARIVIDAIDEQMIRAVATAQSREGV